MNIKKDFKDLDIKINIMEDKNKRIGIVSAGNKMQGISNQYDSYNGSELPPMPFMLHNGKPWYDEVPPVDPEIFKMFKPKILSKDFGKVMVFGTGGDVDKHWSENVWDDIDKDYSFFNPAKFIPEIEFDKSGQISGKQYFESNYCKIIPNKDMIEIYGYRSDLKIKTPWKK